MILTLALFGPFSRSTVMADAEEQVVTRIAFGSCCHQSRSQAIWPSITAQKPDVFLFLGDNIYGDTLRMDVLRKKYGQLLAEPGYQNLQQSGCRILATWDDHDYGLNDAGAEFPAKEGSQKVFLEAFEVPKEREPWTRPGIYDAYQLGPEGQRVQIILLDTRYFRSELVRMEKIDTRILGRYAENSLPGATILGEAQWNWLEEKLKEPADFRIIASSIQVIPVDHFWERWQNFPKERSRLFQLLRQTKATNTILLSGDRHLGEIMRLPEGDPTGPGFQLFEVTSSGLNQTFDGGGQEPNRYRLGENVTTANFGLLTIDWEEKTVVAEIRDGNGEAVRQIRTPLNQPSP